MYIFLNCCDLKLCYIHSLVMQFGHVEAEIEFFASLVKADGWLTGDVSLIDYAFVLMYIDYEIYKKNMCSILIWGCISSGSDNKIWRLYKYRTGQRLMYFSWYVIGLDQVQLIITNYPYLLCGGL